MIIYLQCKDIFVHNLGLTALGNQSSRAGW